MTQRPVPALDWPGIVAELHRRGMTLTELAKRNGLPLGATRKLRSTPHFKAQKIVAEFLGMKPEDLWPDRHHQRKPRILDTVKYPPMASQNAEPSADKGLAA